MSEETTSRNHHDGVKIHDGVLAWRVILTLGLSAMGFLGNTYLSTISGDLKELKTNSEQVNVHFAHIDEQMSATQMAIKDTYRADDARRDQAETTAKLADLNRRVESLERAMSGVKQPKELSEWRRN